MKRFLVIPIMLLYLLAVPGVMIHLHYCGKTLESWNIFARNAGCGEGECGDESKQPDSCCEDKVISSKVSQDQHFSDVFKLRLSADATEAIIPQLFVTTAALPSLTPCFTTNQSNAPPGLWENIPLYKLHSSFTYYG